MKPRNDEAIQFAVDAAVRKLPGGKQHIQNIQAVREALESHQQTDWRKNLGTLELTERFEHVMASETITRGGRGNQQAGAAPAQGGQEKIERKFERRPHDYELTADDPRVQHLVLVSKIVSAEVTPEQGVAKAKEYLLSAGLISLQSPQEKAAIAAKKGEAVAAGVLYSLIGEKKARAEVRRLEAAIKAAPNDVTKKQLETALTAHIANQVIAAKRREDEAAKEFQQWVVGIIAFILILAIIIPIFG
ncbi:MAG: hypothetical protein WA082_01520 [Candidatus Moraniibacteriota bacterium]